MISLQDLSAFLRGYTQFKVVANPYRERVFTRYQSAESYYLRSIYRKDDKSELWGKHFLRGWIKISGD